MPSFSLPGAEADPAERTDFRWLMSSDVCKHCTSAACLDVCPTGSLFRTEFGTVVVQEDICNGCGYCVPACPFGVIDRRIGDEKVVKNVGIAQKCTLCYDRIGEGQNPACAQACPTQSIQFGDVDELRERAAARLESLHQDGVPEARLYGADPDDGDRRRRARCSCCWTSRRSTACRLIRSSPPATCRTCSVTRPSLPSLCWSDRSAPSWAGADEYLAGEPHRRQGRRRVPPR